MNQSESKPKVSVIIPTYNRPDLLERAANSALSQTLENIEVIVVDDGSEVDYSDVIAKFEDDRLTYLEHDENRGGSAARNTGIEAAQGEYIAFLDDDDQWKSPKLSRQVEVLDELSDDWVAVYCDIERNRPNKIVGLIESFLPSGSTVVEGGEELIPEIMMKRLHIGGGSTVMVRSDIVERIDGFDESFERHQDIEFLLRILKQGKLKYINESFVVTDHTGYPPLEVIERSNIKYKSYFVGEIYELKNEDEDVLGVQEFRIAKSYFYYGEFRKGVGSLIKSHIPRKKDYFVVIYFVLSGIIRKLK